MIAKTNRTHWTVPAAYWTAQSLHSNGFVRQEKWREARKFAAWLPETPPDEHTKGEWLLQALTVLVKAVETRSPAAFN